VPAAIKFCGNAGNINLIGCRAGHHPDAFNGADKDEQGIGVQQVAEFVGNTGDFLGHFLCCGGSDDESLPVDGMRVSRTQEAVIDKALLRRKRRVEIF